MRFPYIQRRTPESIVSLGGDKYRYRPVIAIGLASLNAFVACDATLDSGSDDTLFPDSLAPALGMDLSNAPLGGGTAAGGGQLSYRYAQVDLHLSDGGETFIWKAIVGFMNYPMKRAAPGSYGNVAIL